MFVFTSERGFELNVANVLILILHECILVFRGGRNSVNSLSSHLFPLPGIANEQKKLYGTQFHPEVDLTERGMEMLRTFLFEIAGCTSNFTV